MEKYINPHMSTWEEYTRQMSEAMKKNDTVSAQKYKLLAESEYSRYKEDVEKMNSCNGFAACNAAIQEALPRLIKENTAAVKEIMQTIQEDNNLKAQASFYNSMHSCSANDTLGYINEAINLVASKIDLKTIKESNDKMVNLVRKYGILPENAFSDEKKKMFESCEYLLSHKKKIGNLNEYTNQINELNEYVKNNKVQVSEKKQSIASLIGEFNDKYTSMLNTSEIELFNEIVSEKTTDERKQEIFNEMKQECLNGLSQLLKEDNNSDDSQELSKINETINSKTFNNETFIADCAKLMELREILLEK